MKKLLNKDKFILCLYFTLIVLLLFLDFIILAILNFVIELPIIPFYALALAPPIACYLVVLLYEKMEDMNLK